jgi:DNA (cytosine-5)-methyltransferase 1
MIHVATSPIRVMSLCSGYGGLDLGIRLACPGAITKLYVEREATAAGILVARIEDGSLDDAPIWSDIKTFDARPWRGYTDLVVAGYPCTPFSHAGQRRGAKDERHLWPHVARIIGQAQPECVFLENVEGHLSLGFREVAAELRRLGYSSEAGLFSAEEVGAPHRRKRLFALAVREGGGCRELRKSSWGAGRRGQELEDAAWNGGDGQGRQGSGRRRGIREAGAGVERAVGDAERARLDGRTRRGIRTDGRPLQAARSGRSDSEVADASDGFLPVARRKSQERNGAGSAGAQLADSRRGVFALFPPGPDDLEAWREILSYDASLEPALRGDADERSNRLDGQYTPSRVDRLRALGNAVVPLTAGLAFTVLRDRVIKRLVLLDSRAAAA